MEIIALLSEFPLLQPIVDQVIAALELSPDFTSPAILFFAAAIVAGTPLLFATVGEILTERAGNLNLGVEGMMLMGAVIGYFTAYHTANPVLAVLLAAFTGALGGLIYAFVCITLKANQVVTGLTLTIFGTGFANLIGKSLIGQELTEATKMFFTPIKIPVLGDLPVIGRIFFSQDTFVYFGYLTAILGGIYLYKTRFGLSLRAVGENPKAADAASIKIYLYRYVHVLIGGALCGLGGAYLSLAAVKTWQDSITAGKGWIAIALVIFATWNPWKAILGAFLFGGLDIIGFRLNLPISTYIFDMLPYVATIAVLIITTRKYQKNAPPKALGVPYLREER